MPYLDHNATTRPLPEVVEIVRRALTDDWANPSSIHRAGQRPRQGIELARKALADLIGVRPRTLTLCGSGTEAIDLAIRGAFLARNLVGRSAERAARPAPVLVTTRAEHSAIRELAVDLERREHARVLWAAMRPDGSGVVDADALEQTLRDLIAGGTSPDAVLVSVQWANNETGAIQPVQRIAAACRALGVLYHCDATQWVGKLPTVITADLPPSPSETTSPAVTSSPSPPVRAFDPSCLSPDLLTFAPHKFHGPKGIGVLYARPGVRTAPLILGEQELGRRGGTENVPGILGAGVAADLARAWLTEHDGANIRRGRDLRDRFERELLARVPDARVNGPASSERAANQTPSQREGAGGGLSGASASGRCDATNPDGAKPATPPPRQSEGSIDPSHPAHDPRLWNTSSIAFPRLEAEALLLLLSERGVAASAGSACSSGSLEPSSVLLATGIPPELAHGTLRFSIGRDTTEAEIDEAAATISACVERLRGSWKPPA